MHNPMKYNASTGAGARLAEGVRLCPPEDEDSNMQGCRAIAQQTHLSYRHLTPNKHIIANIFAELASESPGDWLCIYTLIER